MHLKVARPVSVTLAACFLATFSLAAVATSNPPDSMGGVGTTPDAITVGQMAKAIVTHVALNTPAGGVDEKYAMGVITALGYRSDRSALARATVGDLQSMLMTLGVETATGHPEEAISQARFSQSMNQVRGSLPRFNVPDASGVEGVDPPGRNNTVDPPGPCRVAFQQCKSECFEKSPSGTGDNRGRCIRDCAEAFFLCRKNRERPPDRH